MLVILKSNTSHVQHCQQLEYSVWNSFPAYLTLYTETMSQKKTACNSLITDQQPYNEFLHEIYSSSGAEKVDGKLNVALKLRRGREPRPRSVLNSEHLSLVLFG